MGVLDRIGLHKLTEGLSRTREGIVGKLARVVTMRGSIDDAMLQQLEEILLGADVGAGASTEIIDAMRKRVREDRYSDAAELQRLLREELARQLGAEDPAGSVDWFHRVPFRPYVIMVVGINGVGKTTTIGKLAHGYSAAGKKVWIGAADTFRAAANEQLHVWARRAGAEMVQQKPGADPAAVAFDAVHSAVARGADVVVIDTAGRLHTKVNLMEELRKMKRALQKQSPAYPHEVLLVIDASTGQNGLQQARQFAAAVGVTGLVVTKLDGTARGGIVFPIVREMQIPVKFIGVGEKIDDLQPFDRRAFVDALFGEGLS